MSVGTTLGVAGQINCAAISSSGTITAATSFSTPGSMNVGTTLGVTGLITASGGITVTTTKAVTLSGTATLTVGTGATSLGGTLGVTGQINCAAISSSGTITAATGFNITSDYRIKKNISDLNCQSSLKILRKIKPREYTLIDKNKEAVYGFIAQELKEFIPNSIELMSGYIPSVYENAFVNGNSITLINKSTTDISCCDLKLRDKNNEDIIVNVTSIHDNKTFSINTDITQSTSCMDICGTILDKYIQNGVTTYMIGSQVYTGEVKQGIFVYGSHVEDFHTINKDTIWTVTLSATQEMDVQLQEARRTIRTLEERIAAIEKRLS